LPCQLQFDLSPKSSTCLLVTFPNSSDFLGGRLFSEGARQRHLPERREASFPRPSSGLLALLVTGWTRTPRSAACAARRGPSSGAPASRSTTAGLRARRRDGRGTLAVARDHYRLGCIHRDHGRLAEAKKSFKVARRLCGVMHGGEGSYHEACACDGLGVVYHDMGRYGD